MMLRTVQVLMATLLIAGAIIGCLWVLGIIDPTEAKTNMLRIGGVIAICLVATVAMIGIFSLGGGPKD
ncbi:MAG: hypothetical protein ACU84Q_17410 [Gammaproteobacteria bacterium]